MVTNVNQASTMFDTMLNILQIISHCFLTGLLRIGDTSKA